MLVEIDKFARDHGLNALAFEEYIRSARPGLITVKKGLFGIKKEMIDGVRAEAIVDAFKIFEKSQVKTQVESKSTTRIQKDPLDLLLESHDKAITEYDEKEKIRLKKLYRRKDVRKDDQELEAIKQKIYQIRRDVQQRFPDVITDFEKLKTKAHDLASFSEKEEMRLWENKLDAAQKRVSSSGGVQLLVNTKSSVLRGAAASMVAGPLAGGIVYSSTEASNAAIRNSNAEKAAKNASISEANRGFDEIKDQLKNLYTRIIHNHDSSVKIHIFKYPYL